MATDLHLTFLVTPVQEELPVNWQLWVPYSDSSSSSTCASVAVSFACSGSAHTTHAAGAFVTVGNCTVAWTDATQAAITHSLRQADVSVKHSRRHACCCCCRRLEEKARCPAGPDARVMEFVELPQPYIRTRVCMGCKPVGACHTQTPATRGAYAWLSPWHTSQTAACLLV